MNTSYYPANHNQKGVALISTLLVFAVVSILVSQMILHTQTSIERTQWITEDAQAWQNALGGEALARIQLVDALAAAAVSPLLRPQPAYPTEQGEISIQLVDLQSRINLNNLLAAGGYPGTVRRLLLQQSSAANLTDNLQDWIDDNNHPTGTGGEDSAYINLSPPYKAANRPLIDPAQLLAVGDATPDNIAVLSPLVSALPAPVPININTAPEAVLNAIAKGLDGQQIATARNNLEGGFQSIESFLQSDITAGIEFDSAVITTESQWYAINVRARFGNRHATLFSRIKVDMDNLSARLIDRTSGIPLTIEVYQPNPDNEKDNEDTDPLF